MRYLTKEWCALHKLTDLHVGLRVHKMAKEFNEKTYLRLRRRKEKAFIIQERELYDFDPRTLLEEDNTVFVRADKFISGDVIHEEDTFLYEMSEQHKEDIHKLIEAYDIRQPFDVQECMHDFNRRELMTLKDSKEKIPAVIYNQIADPRVFALGYSTREIIQQLKQISEENEKIFLKVLNDFQSAQQGEDISDYLKENFEFHDCKVLQVKKHKNIVIDFDSRHSFTKNNQVIFHDAVVIHEDKAVEGMWWIYEEIYKTYRGYEVHILFADENDNKYELTIESKEITIERV